jgi:uncharacterized repeat protein (TIGR01451 family)
VKPTADEQKALDQLLADQQDRSSHKYHQWLNPEQFADSFGLNSADMERIASWLQSEGFTVQYKAHGRNWIAFSGTAGQIARTFDTEIHRYIIGGETHFANATNSFIPAALADIVISLGGLNDFNPRPTMRKPQPVALRPHYTGTLNFQHYLAPGDVATIYDITPLYGSGFDGTGQTIVVVGQSDIYAADIAAFRSGFGLSSQTQQQWPNCVAGSLCMLLTPGGDPGYTNLDDLQEGELDVEWAGAVARSATIVYAYSSNIFDSVYYAIDFDLGPVISMSYGVCETDSSTSQLATFRSQAQEANSMGITWVAASGDAGAADCDQSPPESQATHGLAVNAPASVPEVTAVGGTEFSEGSGSYWQYFSGANGGTATSYIPEISWNDNLYGTDLNSTLAASGGGVSTYFPTPSWQTGPGFPNGGGRDVPDVALSASADHDAYIICYNQTSCFNIFGDPNEPLGGTSASTPVFAGILTLLNQYLEAIGAQAKAGLGNINPTLYWLAQTNPSAFHDVTSGSNIVPCQIGTPNCSTGYFGYSAEPGYDRVTGLGSVDATVLIASWSSVPVLTVTKTHAGKFTQGQSGVSYTVTVSNAVGTGPTSGTVTVTDALPTGLTATAIGGTGWGCTLATLTCTTSNVLNGGTSYPPITVTVNVASNAAASLTNQVSVSGGGSAMASGSDPTTIILLPILSIASTHTGSFTQGQTGATYNVTVSNSAAAGPTSGTVTATDTLPTGLTATAIGGTGWICTLATLTCMRSDVLNAGAGYQAITVTVNVAGNAAASVTNQASVSGGGSAMASGRDLTAISPALSPCDLYQNGNINAADVQLIANEALGISSSVNDLTGDLVVNVVDVQIEINAALGLGCSFH